MRFDYLGLPLIARVVPHSSGSLYMQLMGKVGRLPYSMEGQNRRLGAMMLRRSKAKRRPTRFAVTKNGEVAPAGDLGRGSDHAAYINHRCHYSIGKYQTISRYISVLYPIGAVFPTLNWLQLVLGTAKTCPG